MKFVLYGLPCAGKTTLLNGINIPVIHGSTELNKLSGGQFSNLSEEDKNKIRIKYAENLFKRNDNFISDGHYSFENDIVFTEADGELYDVFIYLFCKPDIIMERLKHSSKNSQYSRLSANHILKWQNFEIEGLRKECHKRNKDFYVVNDISSFEFQRFIDKLLDGFSSYRLAENVIEQIKKIYPAPCSINICDGDKTIIIDDSFRICTDDYVTLAYDGNFYTGWQSLKFTAEVQELTYRLEMLNNIRLNKMIYSRIANQNYIILSSGIKLIWDKLSEKLDIENIIADTLISADTKYFVVKLLRKQGYDVTAYGDGKNDLYMLREASKGYLFIGEHISRSLENTDLSGIELIYSKEPYILNGIRNDLSEEIAICKSSSGINGAKLAASHFRLGQLLGEHIKRFVPNRNAAVLILERGGRFFGDGLYTNFGGIFYSFNPKTDSLPKINESIVLIVDSVINTGKSMISLAERILSNNPKTEIFIVTNVIQCNALKILSDYKIFAVRVSDNSYIGKKQSLQIGGEGPDTADRLFNYIK